MRLRDVASYFSRTPIYGWDGSGWTDTGVFGTYYPYDRFISERPFGLKRRMLEINPETPLPSGFSVIKVGLLGPIYMVGTANHDIMGVPYSSILLLHEATRLGKLIRMTKVTDASGVTAHLTKVEIPDQWCDVERISFVNTREFPGTRLSDTCLRFPAGTTVLRDDEALIDSIYYDIEEVYEDCGFVTCRALPKVGPAGLSAGAGGVAKATGVTV